MDDHLREGKPSMLKDHDAPREPARSKATRKWKNNDLTRRFKEEKTKAPAKEHKELEVGDVIENEGSRHGNVLRAQTKFLKDLKEMLEGHANRNALLYHISLRRRINRLKLEKLRRLELRAAQQTQETSKC
jgi:hypothetical protein